MKCVFWFSLQISFFLKNFSFQEEFSDIWSKISIGRRVKDLLFLSDFNENWIFSTGFSENSRVSNFMILLPIRVELFDADGDRRKGMKKLRVVFRNYENVF